MSARPRRPAKAKPTPLGVDLAAAMPQVARQYCNFVAGPAAAEAATDARLATAYHAAGRAALAHLEQLFRIVHVTGGGDGVESDALRAGQAALADARSTLAAFAEEDTDGGDIEPA